MARPELGEIWASLLEPMNEVDPSRLSEMVRQVGPQLSHVSRSLIVKVEESAAYVRLGSPRDHARVCAAVDGLDPLRPQRPQLVHDRGGKGVAGASRPRMIRSAALAVGR